MVKAKTEDNFMKMSTLKLKDLVFSKGFHLNSTLIAQMTALGGLNTHVKSL